MEKPSITEQINALVAYQAQAQAHAAQADRTISVLVAQLVAAQDEVKELRAQISAAARLLGEWIAVDPRTRQDSAPATVRDGLLLEVGNE